MKEQVTTGSVEGRPLPFKKKKKKDYMSFNVPHEVFKRFENGSASLEKWTSLLDNMDDDQRKIVDYATENKQTTIVLRNSRTGKLKIIKRGNG